MPKRLLYVINGLGAGGAERQLVYLLGGLDRARYEPTVLTIYDEQHTPYHYKAALDALGIPMLTLAHGTGKRGRTDALWRYTRLMWRLRPALVQGCLHYANLIARVARPFCPSHILLTSARNVYLPGELRSETRTCWLDDGLIVNSLHIRAQVEVAIRRSSRKIQVIHNGVPIERFQEKPDDGIRRREFGDTAFVIGLIGRIARQKDHATLLKALHIARADFPLGLKVFFLGAVEEADTQRQIEALIREYDLEHVVRQYPATDDVAPYYHAADVIVLPSLREGFSNVVLEAFASGKPVIASTDADAMGLIAPGVTGWHFPTGDAAALAECLRQAWQMPASQRAQVGDAARQVAARYSVEAMVSQYSQLYASLLSE
jgi:glycosyltransferase involved in cell wall biosynthesis